MDCDSPPTRASLSMHGAASLHLPLLRDVCCGNFLAVSAGCNRRFCLQAAQGFIGAITHCKRLGFHHLHMGFLHVCVCNMYMYIHVFNLVSFSVGGE